MKGLFNSFEKLKDGLRKTKENIFGRLTQILTGKASVDENLIEEIREILYQADIGYDITESIIEKINSVSKSKSQLTLDEIINIVKGELLEILKSAKENEKGIDFQNYKLSENERPKTIIIVGVNGTGKTTSIGKIAYQLKQNNYKVLIAAADTFRAAANEQLSIWAQRASVEILENKNTKDPGAVVYESLDKALKNNIDVVLIDTAGRLHTKTDLMNELNKIIRVHEKKLNRQPNEVLLVVDATTGQNAVVQIDSFLKYVPLTGLILTKLDGTAKGGVIFQIVKKFKIPVKFVGVGEGLEDLQPFEAEKFIQAIFEN